MLWVHSLRRSLRWSRMRPKPRTRRYGITQSSIYPSTVISAQVAASAQSVLEATKGVGKVLMSLADSSLKDTVRIDAGARHLLIALGRVYCGEISIEE